MILKLIYGFGIVLPAVVILIVAILEFPNIKKRNKKEKK